MRLPVVLREPAQGDVDEAIDWYNARKVGLGRDFLSAVEECLQRIAEHPQAFPICYRGARMALLRRFPYLVIYRDLPEFIAVVAVMHAKRHPRRWKRRINQP